MRKELLTDRDDIFVVHDFLTPEECERYIARSEAAGYGDAPINSLGGPVIRKDFRNNERVIIDDFSLAADLWLRLRPFVPDSRGSWKAAALNERFRFYRYDPGQQFDWHFDGAFERSPTVHSALTFMVYLNGGCEGGETEFNLALSGSVRDDDPMLRVTPERGKALVFVHNILHRGSPVLGGRKYVLRSDVMYTWTLS